MHVHEADLYGKDNNRSFNSLTHGSEVFSVRHKIVLLCEFVALGSILSLF